MQHRRILSLLAILFGVVSCKSKEATIYGSVFIAPRGGESFKVALVEVGALGVLSGQIWLKRMTLAIA